MNSENTNSEEEIPLLKSLTKDEGKQYNQLYGNWQAMGDKMVHKDKFLNTDIQTLKQPKVITSTYLGIERGLAEIVDFVKTDDFNKLNDSEISELRNDYKRLVNLKFDVLHPSINLHEVKELKTFSETLRSNLGTEDNIDFSVRFTELQEITFTELNKYYTEKEKNAVNLSSGNYDNSILTTPYTPEQKLLIKEMFKDGFREIEALEFLVANYIYENDPKKVAKAKHIHYYLVEEFRSIKNNRKYQIHKESFVDFMKSRYGIDIPDKGLKVTGYKYDTLNKYSEKIKSYCITQQVEH